MSTQGGREPHRGYRRRRNLDLNVPASEIRNQDGPSVQDGTQAGQANQQGERVEPVQSSHRGQRVEPVQSSYQGQRVEPVQSSHQGQVVEPVQSSHQGQNFPPAPIDVEALDDDVVESSPRAFAEAKSKRTRRSDDVVIVDSDERASRPRHSNCSRRRRTTPQKPVVLINLETSNAANIAKPPPPPPKEVTFNCPICMGPLVEEMSTKCGHIFCKACIKSAIAAQAKCPTCRKKITMRELIRVFLPAAS